MTELMRRTDAIGYCPRQCWLVQCYGDGLQAFAALSPLPPQMQAGLSARCARCRWGRRRACWLNCLSAT